MSTSGKPPHIAFVSSNVTWGGSEDLWSAAAATLAARGCRVTVFKNRLDPREPGVERLRAAGCRLKELAKLPLLP
ncbi:MAG TPA: hypothetical protein VGX37_01875, partial [Allosphingosinicella sp.]|nr:hypothetical protein [Allosphingosinicella sp.]